MSSPNGRMAVDKSPGHRSSRNHSVETMRTRRSHRSRSRSKDRRERAGSDKLRSHDIRSDRGSHRDRRSRSRERSLRDRDGGLRDRDRERDRDRRRDRDDEHRPRDREREHRRDDDQDRRDRRRKRSDDGEEPMDARDHDERNKRKRNNEDISARDLDIRRSGDRDDMPPRRDDRPPMRGPTHSPRIDQDHPPPPTSQLIESPPLRRPSLPPPKGQLIDSPPFRRPSPSYDAPPVDPFEEDVKEDDSEQRSVFVSQLAAKMTARDLGYFFEDKLGDDTVLDSRIVTDRLSRRSKGIAYVEFRTLELVEKAIELSGTIVMGLPILVQHTEAERNKTHAGDGSINLPPGASSQGATLYVGSLHFNLTESDIKQVFEPFGALDFVDLHKDPMTGRSKGYAFVHYKRADDAKMALEQMEGFKIAGRNLRVNTVYEKGQTKYLQQDSLEENGATNLNAASRQALMQKLMRAEVPSAKIEPVARPTIGQPMTSRSVLLRPMFDALQETEPDWDKDLAEDVKGECSSKYGQVAHIKVERDSDGEIYVQFDAVDSAKKAIDGLHGRWFGGQQITATFISDAIMQAHR